VKIIKTIPKTTNVESHPKQCMTLQINVLISNRPVCFA